MLTPDEVVPEVLRRNRHEFPFSSYEVDDPSAVWGDEAGEQWIPWEGRLRPDQTMRVDVPMTRAQALMESAPGEEPEVSHEDLADLRELLVDALDKLSPRDQYLVNAFVIRGLSVRRVASELGLAKSHVHRMKRRVMQALRNSLGDHPLVQEFLQR